MNKYDEQYAILNKANIEKRTELSEKIEMRRRQIERLERRLEKVGYVSWVDTVVNLLMKDLEEATGLHGEIYGPFGLRGATSIYLREDMSKSITEQTTKSITLTSEEDGTYYETGEIVREYPVNSIGWLNGFGRETKKLPDTLEEILELLITIEK